VDTLVLVDVSPHFTALHPVSRLHDARPYHALVLVGRAVDALFACWHFHLSFYRLAGTLSAVGDLCFPTDPRPRRRGLTPAKTALLSTLSVP
jgi:hypothetical protein